jgi:hypothetical protein
MLNGHCRWEPHLRAARRDMDGMPLRSYVRKYGQGIGFTRVTTPPVQEGEGRHDRTAGL